MRKSHVDSSKDRSIWSKTARSAEACESCVADYTLECATCGDKFWQADLESVDVPSFDQPTAILPCEARVSEYQETEEKEQDSEHIVTLAGQTETPFGIC